MLIVAGLAISFGDADTVTIEINKEKVVFNEDLGFPFVDENSRTQVPLRATMEKFGATVSWDSVARKAVISYKGKTIDVPIGQKYILKNGVQVANDTEARIVNNRTYLPIRVVLEALDAKVSWDGETKTVIVEKTELDISSTEIDLIPKGLEVGKRAYDISLKDHNGNPVRLSDYNVLNKSKKVILTFWTTWCPSCMIEMDNLIAYYADKPEDVEIIAVNLTNQDDEALVKKYIADKKVPFTVLLDVEDKVGTEYKLQYIPAMFILDKKGVIVEISTGVMKTEKMKEILGGIK